jgi:UDP-N-acetylglucosamine 2-epimerase (non-hydrolysing)
MPEEVNRVVTDALARLLFATSADAVAHLAHEGVPADRIHLVGNPMIDTLLRHRDLFDGSAVRSRLGLDSAYVVATLHRPGNVDDPTRLAELVAAMHAAADQAPVVIPVHPRGRHRMTDAGLFKHEQLHAIDPLGYVEFLGLVQDAAAVVTDSGGIQEETTVLGVPCLTLRPNTERPVTITDGTNRLVTTADLAEHVRAALATPAGTEHRIPPLWDGQAGPRIVRLVADHLG